MGAFIRQQRLQLGMSQRQLATKAGMHHAAISRLESGERTQLHKAEQIQDIADALRVDVSRLLKFQGVTPSPDLPSVRTFFRRKLGVDAAEADVLANLVADYQRQQRIHRDEEVGPWIDD